MEEFNQSKEYKDSVLAHLKKVSQCGCGGMGGGETNPTATVDDLNSKLGALLTQRIVKEWLLTLDEQQLQKVAEVVDKFEQASVVEIFDVMKQKGASNPFQVLGDLFCGEQAEVEELPEGCVEEISEGSNEGPMVVEMKDDVIQTP